MCNMIKPSPNLTEPRERHNRLYEYEAEKLYKIGWQLLEPYPKPAAIFIEGLDLGVGKTGAEAPSDVVGILLVGGLTSVRPKTAAPTASVSLDSDYVCRMPKPYPSSTFGSFGDVNHEGRPVVCGGSRFQGGGVER